MACLVALLLLSLASPTAWAGSTELEALERQAEAVRFDPAVDLQADPQVVAVAVQALKDLQASVERLPEEQRDAGTLRLVEAYRNLARDLFAVPCPSGLDAQQCVVFRGALGEQVQRMLLGVVLHAAALERSDALSRRDRARLEGLTADLDGLAQAVRAAVEAVPSPPPPPVRPEVGSPQPLPEGWAPPAGEPGPEARFAVIRGIGSLRRATGEPLVDLGEDYAPGLDDLYVVELLGRRDGLAELRLGGEVDWDQHCVPHQTLSRFEAVRAWIPEAELMPVLSEDLALGYDDGTGFRLLPGAPVVDGSAWLDGQLISLPQGAATADSYRAGELRLERVYGPTRLPWDAAGTLGGEPFALRQPAFDHGDQLTVSASSPRGEERLITLTEKCGELRFLSAAPSTELEVGGVLGGIGGLIGGASTVTLGAGATVYWADGQPAGQVVRDQVLSRGDLFGDWLRCVERKLGSAEAPWVPLCFDPAELESP